VFSGLTIGQHWDFWSE